PVSLCSVRGSVSRNAPGPFSGHAQSRFYTELVRVDHQCRGCSRAIGREDGHLELAALRWRELGDETRIEIWGLERHQPPRPPVWQTEHVKVLALTGPYVDRIKGP